MISNKPYTLNAATTLQLDLRGLKLVEASAGTGKTHAIGNLYLRMILDGFSVGEILVVTFTKAATEELRGRIRQRIYQALHHLDNGASTPEDAFLMLWSTALTPEALEQARQQLKLALTSMDEAAIYTIHGFCQRALTEHAFHSGQPFDVAMINDDSLLWQEALKDWWRIHAYPLDATELNAFTAAVGSLDKLTQWQKRLRKPGVVLLPEATQWHHFESLCQRLAVMWQAEQATVHKMLFSSALARRKKLYKLDNIPSLLERLNGYFASDYLLDVPLDDLNAVRASQLQASLKKNQHEPAMDHPLFTLVDEVAALAAAMPNKRLMNALQDANAFAHARVAQVKQQARQMAYDDQLTLLERALTDHPALVEALRNHFPIAMIDEFQDTDAVQYSIFHQVYASSGRGGLIMIGDPKQAIYGFRGGDIFAYIKAKHDVSDHYTLDTNWRATPCLIAAVNHLFSQRGDPFIYQEISFKSVLPAAKNRDLLCYQGNEITPLTLWHLPEADNGKPISKTVWMPLLHAHTANEIATLLNAGNRGTLTLGKHPVQAKDIAVLVRNHHEARDLREQLRARGVGAVTAGNQSVFDSDEAEGLRLLLAAIAHCRDGAVLRQALTSSLLEQNYQDIHHRVHNEAAWMQWCKQFMDLHDLWSQRGFMQAFQQLLRQLEIGERLVQTPQAERRLTNLFHLSELLQQAAQSIAGMDALLIWLVQQMTNAKQSGDEAEIRLENDGDLVQIVTIHASKGLEYPIVFIPYLWSCKPRVFGNELLSFYDSEQQRRCLEAGANINHLRLAEKERLAEDVRLAYVALTRACAKVYLVWGNAGANAKESALGWLFHHAQQADDLDNALPNALATEDDVAGCLDALCQASEQNMEWQQLTLEPAEKVALYRIDAQVSDLVPKIFSGSIATDWRIVSFSSLTRDVHQSTTLSVRQPTEDAIFHFPAGSQVGLFLHSMLETMDFQGDVAASVASFTLREAVRYGLDAEVHTAVLQQWMQTMLATALNPQGLTLGDIGMAARLNELSFDFSIDRLDIHRLNQRMVEYANSPLQPLRINNCRGFITGIIDLVFEHDGRFYIADYKSNHLGFSLDAYAPEALQQAVWDRRYDLQYLIYALALHRYLKLRIADYDYDSHFGGVYYLFLRGMRAEHGCSYGVHADRPSRAWIEVLDNDLFRARVPS